MTAFAARTIVSAAKSRDEIERTLSRYGARAFMFGQAEHRAMIGFEIGGRRIKFILALPVPIDFHKTPTGAIRSPEARQKACDQAVRQRWRALALVIKAKLEAVEAGIVTLEDEFLAHTVLPDGRTVSEHIQPGIALAYENGETPPLLPDLRRAS